VENGAEMHEWYLLVEVYAELVAGQGHRCALDVHVDRDLLSFVIFDANQQIVLEATACVIEHSYDHFLDLFLVQYSAGRFAKNTDAFVVA
jgi:hypothetical protein